MKMEVRLRGVDSAIKTLQSLPPEIVSKRGGPVKLSLAKGARLLRDQAKANLAAAIASGGSESTGLLEANVIASRGKPPYSSKGERYLVRVRRKVYPGRKASPSGDTPTVRKSAALLEYGSSQQKAHPWLRPAVLQKGQQVIDVVTDDLLRRIALVVRRQAAKNGNL